MKKATFRMFPLIVILGLVGLMGPGCSAVSVALTPAEVTDVVARGYSVSQSAVSNPPVTKEDRTAYFEVNAELWAELARWYELIGETE